MQDSVGKQLARELFYNECLPSWLSATQIKSSNFLILLGEGALELPLLDELGVRRDHIWSVERQFEIYRKQLSENLGLSLYYGEMNDFLRRLLHSSQRFQVLNLDIEGSYRSQLDPAMTSVILYAWRNPETVIATYSTIGRDSEMLFEGIHALTVFGNLFPDIIHRMVSALYQRYREAGFHTPMRMVYRDLFWLRSIVEHTFAASQVLNPKLSNAFSTFTSYEDYLWQALKEKKPFPLKYHKLLSHRSDFTEDKLSSTLRPTRLYHLLYRGIFPWCQSGRFIKFSNSPDVSLTLGEWVNDICRLFVESPLVYVNGDGAIRRFNSLGDGLDLFQEVLWPNKKIWQFTPRKMLEQPNGIDPKALREIISSIQESGKLPKESQHHTTEGGTLRMSNECFPIFVDSKRQVTEFGKQVIQKLGGGRRLTAGERTALGLVAPSGKLSDLVVSAGRQVKLGTDEILQLLPNGVARESIRAHIAVGRRK